MKLLLGDLATCQPALEQGFSLGDGGCQGEAREAAQPQAANLSLDPPYFGAALESCAAGLVAGAAGTALGAGAAVAAGIGMDDGATAGSVVGDAEDALADSSARVAAAAASRFTRVDAEAVLFARDARFAG